MIRTYLRFQLGHDSAERLVTLFKDHQILETSISQSGCHSAELTVSSDGTRAIVTATWDDPEAYERWTSRPDRGLLATEINELLTVPIDASTRGSQYRIAHVAVPSFGRQPQEQEDMQQ